MVTPLPLVYGELDNLILRATLGALYVLHWVQKCCLATVILPAFTTAAATELTIEGSLRVRSSFFSFFTVGRGNKERKGK